MTREPLSRKELKTESGRDWPDFVEPYDDAPAADLELIRLQPAITRWWWWLVLAAMISAPIAFFGARELATDSYVFSTRLIFNRSHFGAPFYEPPDIYALAALAAAPSTLHELKHELKLQPSVERLEKLLEPDVRGGSGVMTVELEWDDPEKAVEILEWMNEHLVTRVKSLRNGRIQQSLDDLNSQLEQYGNQTDESHQSLIDFRNVNDTYDVADHLRTIESEQALLQKELSVAHSEEDALAGHVEVFTDLMEKEESPSESLSEADLDSVDLALESDLSQAEKEAEAKYARVLDQLRQNRLETSIREERARSLLSTQLAAKNRELSNTRNLFQRNLVPQIELDKLQDEVRLLELQLSGSDKVKQWETQLNVVSERVDEHMLKAAKQGDLSVLGPLAPTSPAKAKPKYFSEMLEKWKLQLETKRNVIAKMDEALERKQVEKLKLRSLLPESERLERVMSRAEFMRSRTEGQVNDLAMLKRSESNLLTVLDEPSPGLEPIKSNKKKLLVAIYCLSTCILCAPIVLKELFAPSQFPKNVPAQPR